MCFSPSLYLLFIGMVFKYCPRFPGLIMSGYLFLIFNTFFDQDIHFSTLSSRCETLSSLSFNLLLRLSYKVFVQHPEFFTSLFISSWVFFGDSISLLNSTFMSGIVFTCGFFWQVFVVFQTFIRIFFKVCEHINNWCLEVLVLCFS